MATVYEINKGINRSIEFKGIKAQYITYLAIGMVLILLLFSGLYACGLSIYLCLAIILPAAGGLIGVVQHMSKTYGEHGLVKRLAGRRLPVSLHTRSRKMFILLKPDHNGKEQEL